MGLHQIIEEDNSKIGIWKMEEELKELQIILSEINISHLNSEKRKKEFLSARNLNKHLRLLRINSLYKLPKEKYFMVKS